MTIKNPAVVFCLLETALSIISYYINWQENALKDYIYLS